MKFEINTLQDLEIPAKYLLDKYQTGGLFFLCGDLGVGKTTFVKTFAKLLGCSEPTSPTFALMHEYDGKIFHYDLYQITEKQISLAEVTQTFCEDGWHFVEWANEQTQKFAEFYGIVPIWNDFCVSNAKRYLEIKDEP